MSRSRSTLYLTVVTLCAWGQIMLAQQNVGALKGTVKDPSGAIIVGASLTLKSDATGAELTTETDGTGSYAFLDLKIGTYSLSVSQPGFKTFKQTGVRVVSGERQTQDIELAIGEVSETTTVTAELATVDVTSTTTGTTRTQEEIRNLPIQMQGQYRNTTAFLTNLPGVNTQPNNPNTSTGGGLEQVGRGSNLGVGEGFSNNFSGYDIDGVAGNPAVVVAIEDNGQLIPEVIDEFRLATNFNAEYGGNLGSSVVLTTKSGTNSYHGTLFEYFRNDKLDARNFFDTSGKPSPQKQNEYGFVLGGPILKNKLFIFGSLDDFNYRRSAGGTTGTVPTAAMRRGDFSEWLGPQVGSDALGRPVFQGQIFDPATNRADGRGGVIRDPFPGNIIPTDRLSPLSVNLQNGAYPLPTRSGTQVNWIGTANPKGIDATRSTAKVDWYTGDHRFAVGSDIQWKKKEKGRTLTPITVDVSTDFRNDTQYRGRISDTWTPKPNLVVTFRGAINYYRFDGDTTGLPTADFGCKAGMKNFPACYTPLTRITEVSGFGWYWNHFKRYWTTVPINLDASLIKGKHNFKVGAAMTQMISTSENDQFGAGNIGFAARETGLPTAPSSGNGYASFLLGEIDSSTVQTPIGNKYTARSWAFYAQDEYRVTPKLTLNYGLRWEFTQPIHEQYDRIGSFDPTVPNPGAGGRLGALTFWGDGTGRNGQKNTLDTYWKAFGPRFGFAYAVTPKTVFRGYYGILYSPLTGDFTQGEGTPAYGFRAPLVLSTTDGGITSAYNWTNGFPNIIPSLPNTNPAQLNNSSVNFLNPLDNKPARSQNIGAALEREFSGNLLVKVEYVGKWIHGLNRGSRPMNDFDLRYLSLGSLLSANINSDAARAAGIPIPYPGFNLSVAQALRPFPQFNNVSEISSRSQFSLYNAMLVSVHKRFSQGLTFLAGYTFSKQLTLGPVQALNLLDTGKTIMSFDRPQTLTISYSYDLPFGPGKRYLSSSSGVVKQLLGGWQIAGSNVYTSGVPIIVSTRGSIPVLGAQWANRVPDVPIQTSTGCGDYQPNDASSRYLNINAFALPAAFTFGNTRTLPNVRDCGYMNESIAILKTFPITENWRVRFGAEFFNVFNRHIWGGMNADINNPDRFGRYSFATDPRTVQFNLKLDF